MKNIFTHQKNTMTLQTEKYALVVWFYVPTRVFVRIYKLINIISGGHCLYYKYK